MKEVTTIVISKKVLFYFIGILVILLIIVLSVLLFHKKTNTTIHTKTNNTLIVIDPGHGGIDGGSSRDELLEKDINLIISKKLRTYLEKEGFSVVLTREEDVSLDGLWDGAGSRHQRDLNARAYIINNSDAHLFLSIHGNCYIKNPNADGSIVLYNDRFVQNKDLAYCIQRALNDIEVDGEKRTIHDPVKYYTLFLLNRSNIPGVIIETAFISNKREYELLQKEAFQDAIAKAIANGVLKYLKE